MNFEIAENKKSISVIDGTHRAAYDQWSKAEFLAAGHSLDDCAGMEWSDEPRPVPEWMQSPQKPTRVRNAAARIAMGRAGLLKGVLAHIKKLPEDHEARIMWEYEPDFLRDNPTLLALAKELGISDEQLDELFLAASQIK